MRLINALIENCLAIVTSLSQKADGLSLAAIAGDVEIDADSVKRVLASLVAAGWVEKDAKGDYFRLSFKMPSMAHNVMQFVEAETVLQSELDKIGAITGELVRVSVLANGRLSTAAFSQGSNSGLVCQIFIGDDIAVHTSASGKAWLASLDRDTAMELARLSGLRQESGSRSASHRTPQSFLEELDLTRERGFGVAIDEEEAFVGSVAAAIKTDGEVVGTLGIVAPTNRLDQLRIAELGSAAKHGADRIAELWPLWEIASSRQAARVQQLAFSAPPK